jgi:dTDP-glucose 4,6-dehydratase
VDRSIDDPSVFVRMRTRHTDVAGGGTLNWGASAGERGAVFPRFHREVFGSLAPHEPRAEESRYAQLAYAASKAAADHLVRAYANTFGVRHSQPLFQQLRAAPFPEKLLPLCLINILERRRLPIYGDGLQLRNWLHVDDHCRPST